jgi:hypothetical protein
MSARKPLPPTETIPAIARLRQLAAEAADHGLLVAGPPHPDAALLALCAHYLDLSAEAEAISREARKRPSPYRGTPEFDAALAQRDEQRAAAKLVLGRLGKTAATTAAGVYAKATIVVTQNGYMTAPRFMLSLAADLVNAPGLRAVLWPAEVETEQPPSPGRLRALRTGEG